MFFSVIVHQVSRVTNKISLSFILGHCCLSGFKYEPPASLVPVLMTFKDYVTVLDFTKPIIGASNQNHGQA
jgi:hypothetical protein